MMLDVTRARRGYTQEPIAYCGTLSVGPNPVSHEILYWLLSLVLPASYP